MFKIIFQKTYADDKEFYHLLNEEELEKEKSLLIEKINKKEIFHVVIKQLNIADPKTRGEAMFGRTIFVKCVSNMRTWKWYSVWKSTDPKNNALIRAPSLEDVKLKYSRTHGNIPLNEIEVRSAYQEDIDDMLS